MTSTSFTLSDEQNMALELLNSGENVFITGGAGSGKSFVLRHFMMTQDEQVSAKDIPILASTGAAAVLLGGRTFHSFFGLGIMEGGLEATLARAGKDGRLMKRLRQAEGVVIDEISMISGEAFHAAEYLARYARQSDLPWGGLRIIAVGDFAQLPPVTMASKKRDWCFLTETWTKTNFLSLELTHNQRVQEKEFLDVLQTLRKGELSPEAIKFLNSKTKAHDEAKSGTRLFPRREQSEQYNQKKLDEIPNEEHVIDSIYLGEEKNVQVLKKSAPLPEKLRLKVGSHVLFIKNDPNKRWVNGTRGKIVSIEPDVIVVKKDGGREVKVEKAQLSILDADGNVRASMIQFPLLLAYATTIHKSQGATLDELWCDLGSLWEPGQAYVALSRLRSAEGLHIVRWSPRSFIADPQVNEFYKRLKTTALDEELL